MRLNTLPKRNIRDISGENKTMAELQISDLEIQETERLLLPVGCHFDEDAIRVIRHWESTDVSACPGSGKTTVLLAKLKLLADRMPLDNGAGICVLSHTNVAVNEIKSKLSEYAGKLMGYPNYVGTIQSFIDKFVVQPYIRRKVGRTVQPLDDRTYAKHMLHKMRHLSQYKTLKDAVNIKFQKSEIYTDPVEYVKDLYINERGSLCIGNQLTPLAGPGKPSSNQFSALIKDLLVNDGIIRFPDAFMYAEDAVSELTTQYTDLFSMRFQYVFIDEYQDCSDLQKNALNKLFDPAKCIVFHIGDPDQAIYNSNRNDNIDWCPSGDALTLSSTCRYGQEIADILPPLRKDKSTITSSIGTTEQKPVLIIYDNTSIKDVPAKFISILEEKGLHDPNGVYKVIGFIKKEDSAGTSIGSYWDAFDGGSGPPKEFSYWGTIDEICRYLQKGKLYRVEGFARKLLCRLLHYAAVKDAKTGKDYTMSTIRTAINEKYNDIYRTCIIELSQLTRYDRASVDDFLRDMYNSIFVGETQNPGDIFNFIPVHFMEEPKEITRENSNNENTLIDPLRGRKIQFDTVHGVKGETHDATLYLETELKKSSDIIRVLHYYGVGKTKPSSLHDYSRKIVYVGMSRPRKLLCVAIRNTTYERGKETFQNWDKVFLCANDQASNP